MCYTWASCLICLLAADVHKDHALSASAPCPDRNQVGLALRQTEDMVFWTAQYVLAV